MRKKSEDTRARCAPCVPCHRLAAELLFVFGRTFRVRPDFWDAASPFSLAMVRQTHAARASFVVVGVCVCGAGNVRGVLSDFDSKARYVSLEEKKKKSREPDFVGFAIGRFSGVVALLAFCEREGVWDRIRHETSRASTDMTRLHNADGLCFLMFAFHIFARFTRENGGNFFARVPRLADKRSCPAFERFTVSAKQESALVRI